MHSNSNTVMKKSPYFLALLAGLLLIAGTSCNQATGNGCLHIDSSIETLNERSEPAICAICTPDNDLQNELQKQFAWTQID
jgi:hypothetical protein